MAKKSRLSEIPWNHPIVSAASDLLEELEKMYAAVNCIFSSERTQGDMLRLRIERLIGLPSTICADAQVDYYMEEIRLESLSQPALKLCKPHGVASDMGAPVQRRQNNKRG